MLSDEMRKIWKIKMSWEIWKEELHQCNSSSVMAWISWKLNLDKVFFFKFRKMQRIILSYTILIITSFINSEGEFLVPLKISFNNRRRFIKNSSKEKTFSSKIFLIINKLFLSKFSSCLTFSCSVWKKYCEQNDLISLKIWNLI